MFGNSIAKPRILLVEDMVLLLLDLEQMLTQYGYEVAGMATSVDDGVQLARTLDLDAAVLDVDIGGYDVVPVARTLSERGIPFVLATARLSNDLPSLLREQPRHNKPYNAVSLDIVLRQLLAERGAREAGSLEATGAERGSVDRAA